MSIGLGKNLLAFLGAAQAGTVAPAKAQPFYAQQQSSTDNKHQLGNPCKPESRVKGLIGDNLYYLA